MAKVICKRPDHFECWTTFVDGYRDLHGPESLDVDMSEGHNHGNAIKFVWVAGVHAAPMRAYIAEHHQGTARKNGLERIDEFLERCQPHGSDTGGGAVTSGPPTAGSPLNDMTDTAAHPAPLAKAAQSRTTRTANAPTSITPCPKCGSTESKVLPDRAPWPGCIFGMVAWGYIALLVGLMALGNFLAGKVGTYVGAAVGVILSVALVVSWVWGFFQQRVQCTSCKQVRLVPRAK